ncbi:MAG: sugar phosphate nucleotidyltransferase [Candidatus Kapaibacterium sp.]|jgi:bifunctional UDP-N-acetylglucosamine pyrophosphorylase/glucosamine-1-phosphate N-acetyltransferase|nr:sugar phosphate nucleotidyltransferase [Candidatus Kapabacteria bacterium]
MDKRKLAVVILAAGKGKRMNNPNIPKVLAEIDGKPLIYYVLSEVQNLSPERIVVVVGHHKELVIDFINDNGFVNIEFVEQNQQLGTGHAVDMSRGLLSGFDGDTLILAGDVPLLSSDSLKKFINLHIESKSDASVLSTIAPDPTGYGRIVRDESKNFLKITEHKDANDNIRKIDEINSGIFIVNTHLLFDSLKKVQNNNAQGEYYLTDIIEILKSEDRKVHAINAAPFAELQGINTLEELANAEKLYKLLRKNL